LRASNTLIINKGALFAATQGSGLLCFSLLKTRENHENPVEVLFDFISVISCKTGQPEVLHNRQVAKQPSSLGNMRNAELADHLVSGILQQIFPHKGHFTPRFNRYQPGNSPQGCALSGPIGSDDAYDLAVIDLKAYAVKCANITI
jgi:hypothetical protein